MAKKRAYEESHPWLAFTLDFGKPPLPFTSWMSLGMVQSKIEQVGDAILPPSVSGRLHSLYLAKGVHATTAIEGNTLSEKQVRDRIGRKGQLPQSQEYHGKDIDNIANACNQIMDEIMVGENTELTCQQIMAFNGMVLNGLPVAEEVTPGQIRRYSVAVARYRGAPAEDCGYLLDRLCTWLGEIKPPDPALETAFAVVRAILAHLYIAWIHPFGDGNGRTARLVELQILLSADVPSIAAHLLSNHYNQTRAEYYRQLDLASKSGGDVRAFLQYALQGLSDGLDEQIKAIRKHQREVAWRDYVHERFRDAGGKGAVAHRRRTLALELFHRGRRGIRGEEARGLSPELGRLYANKTVKTISRDINELRKMQLASQATDGRVCASSWRLRLRQPKRRKRRNA